MYVGGDRPAINLDLRSPVNFSGIVGKLELSLSPHPKTPRQGGGDAKEPNPMNANCNTQTLFDAIQNSDVEQVKTLLNDGICPNSRNEAGLAALTLAASIGNADVIIA
ncbi:MAG: hypothetical protein HC925_01805 [Coleofasciculaceae cyanobacterium SM2_3_26]|nr:hypothetical protein [Coleofasciculaceae cyanobacterium SM2_3_26]